MIRLSFTFALALVVLVTAAPRAGAEPVTPALRAVLDASPPDEELSVIVSFTDRVDPAAFRGESRQERRRLLIEALRDRARASQAGLRPFLQARGARQITELWIRNALAVTAPAAVIDQLETWPGVESIGLDEVFQAPTPILSAAAPPQWNIDMIGAPELWAMGHTGQGVVVANMDTGVDIRHDDLQGRWRGGANSWFDPHGQHATPFDANSHGTLTMGVMVAGDATGASLGVAPGAKWIAVKIFNDRDQAFLSDIEQGFQWLLDPDGNSGTDDAPDIVNNSWSIVGSEGTCNEALLSDIQRLRSADIAVVFAAGNEGLGGASTDTSPANNAGSFSVGAISQSQSIAFFSSRGPSTCDDGIFPHLVAPGVSIRSTDLTRGSNLVATDTVEGTSFASPHSAGAMALLLDAFPNVTVSQLESALVDSAVDLGPTGPDNAYGHGLLDVAGAFDLLRGIVITKARYKVSKDKLVVFAKSGLGKEANLKARLRLKNGSRVTKSMSWNSNRGRWQLKLKKFVARFGSRPKSVRVRGPEGAVSKSVKIVK